MKVCIICEGSYPYITGGVSSWIQMLVNNLGTHEFIIYSIGALNKQRGIFKYKIPENIIEIREVFFDDFVKNKSKLNKRFKLSELEKKNLKSILTHSEIDWEVVFNLIHENRKFDVLKFLHSKDYFDIVEEAYNESYTHIPFNNYLWNTKSMLINLLFIIKNSIPNADVYHSVSTGYAGIVGCIAKLIKNKPYILTEHGIYTREREEEIIQSDYITGYFKDLWIRFFYSLSEASYKVSDNVITLYEGNKNVQIEIGCDKNKIDIIPNGIDINDFKIKKIKINNIINIGAIVRIVPIKDIKTMIQSFEVLSRSVENVKLYIMGPIDENPEYFEECRLLLDNLNIKNIIFTGKIDVKKYLNKMDIMLLTSLSEGQPIALLEGMAAKLPHVTTNVGSCKDIIEGTNDNFGKCGIVCPVMDYLSIGNALVKLCKNSNLRNEMGSNAYLRVSKIYSKNKFIYSYDKLYKKMKGIC